MIVRGSELSDLRSALPLAALSPEIAPPILLPQSGEVASADELQVDEVIGLESQEPQLTFESVVAWLAIQDQATKDSCASILAEEVTRIYESAKNEGYLAGRKTGETSARAEIEKKVEMMGAISAGAEHAFELEQQQLQGLCVDVITEALVKICGPILGSEEAAIGAVKQVLSRVREERELVLRVSRDDIDLIQRQEADIAQMLGGRKYEIVADSRVELGGCLVETKLGSLDGRLEVQLREVYETLRLAKLSLRASL